MKSTGSWKCRSGCTCVYFMQGQGWSLAIYMCAFRAGTGMILGYLYMCVFRAGTGMILGYLCVCIPCRDRDDPWLFICVYSVQGLGWSLAIYMCVFRAGTGMILDYSHSQPFVAEVSLRKPLTSFVQRCACILWAHNDHHYCSLVLHVHSKLFGCSYECKMHYYLFLLGRGGGGILHFVPEATCTCMDSVILLMLSILKESNFIPPQK